MLTGVAMSPTIESRFPWYPKLFGNRQAARSIHFLGMVSFVGFLAIHLLMVVLHGFAKGMNKMVMGHEDAGWWGVCIGLTIIAAVALVHAMGNIVSRSAPRAAHWLLSPLVDPPRRALLHRAVSVPDHRVTEISPYFRVNGYPPTAEYAKEQGGDETYERLRQEGFAGYRLEVTGLVEVPALAVAGRVCGRCRATNRSRCTVASRAGPPSAKWAGVRARGHP